MTDSDEKADAVLEGLGAKPECRYCDHCGDCEICEPDHFCETCGGCRWECNSCASMWGV